MIGAARSGERFNRRVLGLALVEAILGTVLVGLLFVAALQTVAASKSAHLAHAQKQRALLLAEALLAEILQQSFEEPDGSQILFGPEGSEASDDGRSAFDDVDDYDAWAATPPRERDGTAIAWAPGYTRRAKVEWADPGDLGATAEAPSGIKRIHVWVEHGHRVLIELTAFRTDAWVEPQDMLGAHD